MSRVRMRRATTASMERSWEYWTLLLLGLFYIAAKCDARAVNVSNSWTMPQEGLNVFYRFFRDRISWFEADAVCQFHHANLVTVDNSFQFDATRDLLRELDVNDIVWIGLMRPQNLDRFIWSNSRTLAANTGYWAESLPLMESPLCAVIDPIRDYRWHALRCGGPETASFLCEMPVPSWAESCILKDLPSLTMQYMADTASIELIRNCGEEGLIRQMCSGKQDRERIMRELICPRERLESKKLSDITNSHFKSLQIIRGIATDNNEDNDIEVVPMKPVTDIIEPAQTEKNNVQRLIEQFNVDELMQSDQPSGIPGEIPKPVKKSGKKIAVAIQTKKPTPAPKKPSSSSSNRGHHRSDAELDDMMMGDQPARDDSSNEIIEPLPHVKKVLPQDLKKKPIMKTTITAEPVTTTAIPTVVDSEIVEEASTTLLLSSSEPSELPDILASTTSGTSIATTTSGAFLSSNQATVGHPMHPQQQRGNIITEEANHQHVKETNDNHFIPPMLLVKSHYVPPSKGHNDHGAHLLLHDPSGMGNIQEITGTTHSLENNQHHNHEQEQSLSQSPSTEAATPQSVVETEKSPTPLDAMQKANSSEIQLQTATTVRNEITTQDAAPAVNTTSTTTKPLTTSESPVPAPVSLSPSVSVSATASVTTSTSTERVAENVITTTASGGLVTTSSSPQSTTTNIPIATTIITTGPGTASMPPSPATDAPSSPPSTLHSTTVHTIATQTDNQNKHATEKTEPPSTPPPSADSHLSTSTHDAPSTEGPAIILSTTTATTTKAPEQPAAPQPTRNFLNEETYPPFKPNRRRSLTKPETPSYFKKILG